jgi:hypothetical protein
MPFVLELNKMTERLISGGGKGNKTKEGAFQPLSFYVLGY